MLDPKALSFLKEHDRIGVAVSGGADSMALVYILRETFPDKTFFAYTVDHGLRDGSAAEAQQVHEWLSPLATHRVLNWNGDKPDTGIQEDARKARYELLHQACADDGARVLCLGHHRDDQAETVLHRLAKGSGVDGLAGMRVATPYHDITLLRPLLSSSHDELVRYCQDHRIDWIEDPSNANEKFARVRLRHARQALESEGLTNERLAKLAARVGRTSAALDHYVEAEWALWIREATPDRVRFTNDVLNLPDEMYLRLVVKAAAHFGQDDALRANMKRLEECLFDERNGQSRFTLANLIITQGPKGLTVERE